MGIRSDVAIAIAPDVTVPDDIVKIFQEWPTTSVKAKCGSKLYIVRNIKWYDFDDVERVKSWLSDLDFDDYKVVVVTPEYGDSDVNDTGGFEDPWSIGRIITVDLYVEDVEGF